jgi:signal transduction histidine kinase/CheY-like chemotaxis protein
MERVNLNILLIEDSLSDANLIREMLIEANGTVFDLDRVSRLSQGLERLAQQRFDLVLLDLSLPDSRGFETFVRTKNYVPDLPIIVLTDLDDKALAMEAVRKGAQDYLLKGEVSGDLLGRAIRYAIERKRVERDLRERTTQMEALQEVALAVASELNLEEVLDMIAAQAARLSRSDAAAVFDLDVQEDLDAQEQILRMTASCNVSQDFIAAVNASRVRIGEGAVGSAVARRESVQMIDAQSDPSYPFRSNLAIDDIRSLLAVPMIKGEKVFGGIVLLRREPGEFSDQSVDLLTTFADHAAVAFENAQLHRQVRRHAEQLEEQVRERTAELRAQHRQMLAVMRNITEGIVVTNSVGAITQMNPVARRWLERTLSPDDAAQLSAAIEDLAARAEERPKRMLELTGLDLELHAAPIADLNASKTRVVVAIHDISHLKALERMKSRFVSNVSHELRTPISTIKLHVQLMEQHPDQWRDHLDVLRTEVERQAQLIESILEISRVDAGRLGITAEPTMLNMLARDLIEAYEARAEKSGLEIEHQTSSSNPVALGDRKRIRQVLDNLMTNAIRYTPSGGRIVVSTGVQRSEARTWATVTVEDTGIGIPEEEIPHIFERFYRGDRPRLMQIPGTGLGLAIVEEIVSLHGGKITVESEVGQGSAFTVWLPSGE